MTIRIYDIDGTLTKVKGDNAAADEFDTYAFWPLISYYFAAEPKKLKVAATAWDRSDKGSGTAFIKSSHHMLQQGVDHFKKGVTAAAVQTYAKQVTDKFIEQDIIRLDAIAHLKYALENDALCILSTGSYLDGAIGFVQSLIEHGLLPEDALEKLVISGATVDWVKRRVTHANIADNKIIGLRVACKNKKRDFSVDKIVGIYVDDPAGNDSGICALKPDVVHLIETHKNKLRVYPQFKQTDWDTINRQELPATNGYRM